MKKTVYKKFYNRFLPLISVEEWHQGEHVVLPKILNKNIYFNHLFVHSLGKGTNIYYDETQFSKGIKNFIDYFKKNPKKFTEFFKGYKKESKEMLAFCKKSSLKDIPKLREIIVKKIWPMINITIILGYYSKENGLNNMGKQALELRKKYDKHIYIFGRRLWQLCKQKFPKQYNYFDSFSFRELSTDKKPSIKELEKRRQGYIYFNGKLFVGKPLEQFAKENNIELKYETAEFKDNAINGTIAMTGKITGRVKIIFEIPQMHKVKEGDILVTSMTVPDFLPAMKKAAAFVTDEGGITCHAAIVAREMKKPCIIGTKIATKVLKEGELVEVDANSGVVKKLN